MYAQIKKMFIGLYGFLFSPWDIQILEQGTDEFVRPKNNNEIMADAYTRKAWNSVTISTVSYKRTFVVYKYTHRYYKKEKILKKYID